MRSNGIGLWGNYTRPGYYVSMPIDSVSLAELLEKNDRVRFILKLNSRSKYEGRRPHFVAFVVDDKMKGAEPMHIYDEAPDDDVGGEEMECISVEDAKRIIEQAVSYERYDPGSDDVIICSFDDVDAMAFTVVRDYEDK